MWNTTTASSLREPPTSCAPGDADSMNFWQVLAPKWASPRLAFLQPRARPLDFAKFSFGRQLMGCASGKHTVTEPSYTKPADVPEILKDVAAPAIDPMETAPTESGQTSNEEDEVNEMADKVPPLPTDALEVSVASNASTTSHPSRSIVRLPERIELSMSACAGRRGRRPSRPTAPSDKVDLKVRHGSDR